MDSKITFAIIIAAILIVGGFIVYNTGATVSAQGSSSVKATPDEVSVYINVETKNTTAVLAQEQNKEISDKLLFELVKIGFDKNELKFVNYNIYQDCITETVYSSYCSPNGYRVYQQLVVKTNRTDKVPSIVDAAINSGSLVSYINFEISDAKQRELKAEALKEASENARIQAESVASGQGKKLGRLVSLQNQQYGGYNGPIAYYAADSSKGVASSNFEARSVAIDISPNEQDITASVYASYKLGWF